MMKDNFHLVKKELQSNNKVPASDNEIHKICTDAINADVEAAVDFFLQKKVSETSFESKYSQREHQKICALFNAFQQNPPQ